MLWRVCRPDRLMCEESNKKLWRFDATINDYCMNVYVVFILCFYYVAGMYDIEVIFHIIFRKIGRNNGMGVNKWEQIIQKNKKQTDC